MAIEDNAEQLPVQPPNPGTTTPGGWFQQNLPTYNTGISGYGGPAGYTGGLQQAGLVPMTGGPGGGPAPSQWTPESLNAYFSSRGVTPNPSSIQYWLSKKAELDARGQEIGDPNYANMRLGMADEFGGGYGGGTSAQGGGVNLGAMGLDPSLPFIQEEARKATERGAASKGTLLTGGLQKALQRNAANIAGTEYGNIFNRNLSLADLGLRGASQYSNAAQNYGNMAAGNIYGQGNIAAQGTATGANAWNGTLGQLGNIAQTVDWSKIYNRNKPVPYAPTPQQSAWWGAGNQGPVV